MTDEEIVLDAHSYARGLAEKIIADRPMMTGSQDTYVWLVTMVVHFCRLMAIAFVAASGASPFYQLFMRAVARTVSMNAEDPKIVQQALSEACKVAEIADARRGRPQ